MELRGVTGGPLDGVLSSEQQFGLNQRQKQSIRSVLDHWLEQGFSEPYAEVVMPTGFGKSRIVHGLVGLLDHDKILYIVGSKNILLDQSSEVLRELVYQETGEEDFCLLPQTSARVVLACQVPHFLDTLSA
jgi:hypothetical protein